MKKKSILETKKGALLNQDIVEDESSDVNNDLIPNPAASEVPLSDTPTPRGSGNSVFGSSPRDSRRLRRINQPAQLLANRCSHRPMR
jgi:hypothetical protein